MTPSFMWPRRPRRRVVRRLTPIGRAALVLCAVAGIAALVVSVPSARAGGTAWSAAERAMLRSLSLASLGPLPPDPSNRVADNPLAAALGEKLFFDEALSSNGRVSCASCHLPDKDFQDSRPLAQGVGTTARRTMPIAGTAYGPWFFWDGRRDSQWSQALGPLESAVEHGGTRTRYAHVVARRHRASYEQLFGRLPQLDSLPLDAAPVDDPALHGAWKRIPAARQVQITQVYANIGKAIAAYERQIAFTPSRFDRWAEAELAGRTPDSTATLTRDEVAGFKLFIGKASCANCHNGPRFTDDHFHNTGVPVGSASLPPDSGRAVGARQAVAGEFACTSRWSDAKPDQCDELRFAVTEGEELVRAYKTPSLRGVAERAPYMHAGQIGTLAAVIAHYDRAPAAPAGHSELKPLRLSVDERRQIEAFLRTLSSPLKVPARAR